MTVFIGVDYAIKNYLSVHADICSEFESVESLKIEELFPKGFSRRSVFSIPYEVWCIIRYLSQKRPTRVVSVGPKVGLLCSIACMLLGIKHVHWFTGQFWANSRFKVFEKSYWVDFLISKFCTVAVADSREQSRFLRDSRISGVRYLPIGGIKGVDVLPRMGARPRYPLNVVFLGRITADKGLDVFCEVADRVTRSVGRDKCSFNIYGPIDDGDLTSFPVRDRLLACKSVNCFFGYYRPADCFSTAHVLMIPSVREGFCSVAVEAASFGVPVLGSDIYGLYDSISDGFSGFNIVNGSDDYVDYIVSFVRNREFWNMLSKNATCHSLKFSSSNHKKVLREFYEE